MTEQNQLRPMGPEDLADWLATFVTDYGTRLIGGCCGTTPEHIRTLVERVGSLEPARPLLVNFMGAFWLAGGIVSLRWAASGDRARRWSVIAGIIGVGAGLLAITRTFLSGYIPELMIAYLIGGVMILTGIMHVATGSSDGARRSRRSWAGVLLGIFEIVMGIMIFISPLSYGPLVYWFITFWAFLGGIILFREAWRHRKQVKEAAKATGETEAGSEEDSPAEEM